MPALTGLRLTTVYGERVDVACAAVLLDMDGTLVDSSACVEAKWRWWSKRYGVDPNTVLAVAHGRRLDDTIRHTAPHLDLDRTVAELARHEEQETTGLDVVPGAPELLAALPAGTWAVVTSAWRTLAQIRLRHVGLSVPEVLVTADDTPAGKPNPDGYLVAAARLAREAADCVVVDDSPVGISAGHAAGMRVIGLCTTFTPPLLNADWVIEDLRSLRRHESAAPMTGAPAK